MMWQKYQLENTVLKATEALTLWKTEKGIIELSKDALAMPIKLGTKEKATYFIDTASCFLTP